MLTNNFKEIVINNLPLIDVRAPIEYEKGAFLNAINLPILNDQERAQVGITYKNEGNDCATHLGYQLVHGIIKEQRVENWIHFVQTHPLAILYCFRGGSRSEIAQNWIYEAIQTKVPRIEGGYKAFRNYLMDALLPEHINSQPLLLGGCTGSGKTQILKKIPFSIDLEKIANHRGSTFGRMLSGQPTQIDFENNLAYAMIQHEHNGYKHLLLEDEGKNIGKSMLPKPFFEWTQTSPLIIVEVPLEERIENTYQEYVIDSQKDYLIQFGEDKGLFEWAEYIRLSVLRIQRRLGLEAFNRFMICFESALAHQIRTSTFDAHKDWVALLLKEYYDPMYLHQINRNSKQILFTGNSKEVLEYLKRMI